MNQNLTCSFNTVLQNVFEETDPSGGLENLVQHSHV